MLNNPLEFSDNGIAKLKELEGFRSKPYKDAAGKLTVGYGHLIVDGDGVGGEGDVINDLKATELLEGDVASAVSCVNECVTNNDINQNQFDALVIFTYNVGNHALHNSTLLKMVNAGNFVGASNEFMMWDKVHNSQGMFVEVAGLKVRRQAEQDLFNTEIA